MLLSKWLRCVPWLLLAAATALVGIGWLGLRRDDALAGGTGHFVRQQLLWSVLATLALVGVAIPSYRVMGRLSYPLFVVAILLLTAVYLFHEAKGAQRWIRLGPLGMQPSEFAKVAFVVALARYLMYRENYRRLRGLLPPWL